MIVVIAQTLRTPKKAATPTTAPWRALPVVLLAQFLAVADFFIVNVALPSIDHALHAGPAALQFVVAGYGLAYASSLVAGGRLGDAYGRRRLMRTGMAAFTVASAVCGLAPNAGLLIAARVAQGIAAGAMTPQVLATIQANFAGYDRQRALGFFGATTGAGTVAGQLLGGILVQADLFGLGWRPVFLLNVPLGLAGLVAARLVPQTRAAAPVPVDRRGAVLLGAAILLLLVPVSVGREQGWPVWCWAMLAGAPVIAAAFWGDQRRAERAGRAPLLPPSLVGLPGFRRGLFAALLLFPCFGGFMLVTAVTLQDGRGFTPLVAGLSLVPLALAFLVLSLSARRIVDRFGLRAMVAGAGVLTAGMSLFAIQAQRGYDHLTALSLVPAMALIGAGSAVVMVPLFGTILAAVPVSMAGAASGVLTTTQQAGLALGAGGIGTLFFTLVDGYGWRTATVGSLWTAVGLAVATMLATARISISVL